MLHAPIPTVATGKGYQPYLIAARKNLEDLLSLTQSLRDPEFEREAQRMLDCLNDAAIDAEAMIAEADINCQALDDEDVARQMVTSVTGMAA